jgi:methylmalonyl-CoA mutase cobalamin-binding domain/chain
VTNEEILQLLYDETLVGNAPAVRQGVEDGLEQGLEPERMLYDALIPSLEEVGARFERGDFFVPEMLIAGKAMAGALEVLRPLLAETGAEPIGTVVMGTVKGDVHDIGKNLVNIMFEGAGFQVIDLGVQVAPEKFVAAIEQHQPDIVGFSAFLTTTMPMFKANINALNKAGLRDKVMVMVGGAPVTQEYADVVGADGYAADASAAVVKAKQLIAARRAAHREAAGQPAAQPTAQPAIQPAAQPAGQPA